MSGAKAKTTTKSSRIRLPRTDASYAELADFFDRHDGVDLQDQGIMEIDPDRADLDCMLLVLDSMRREGSKP
jgi:hypothetical protein